MSNTQYSETQNPKISNSDLSPSEWLAVLQQCATQADDIASHYFSQPTINVIQKTDNSPVTIADQKIEQDIRSYFATHYPDVGIIGEEYEIHGKEAETKLIIDPIDATSNFIRRIPICACLMAIEHKKKIVAGLISNGITKERWEASRGNGAFYNSTKIHVSTVSEVNHSQAFYGSLYGREARGDLNRLLALLEVTKRQRGIGDFMMHCWVAQGFGEVAIDFGLNPWDIAPSSILVEEAGGIVTAVNGQAFNIYEGSILSSNGQMHQTFVELYNYS